MNPNAHLCCVTRGSFPGLKATDKKLPLGLITEFMLTKCFSVWHFYRSPLGHHWVEIALLRGNIHGERSSACSGPDCSSATRIKSGMR